MSKKQMSPRPKANPRVLLRVILFAIYVLATPVGVPKPGFEQLIGGLL